MVPGFGGQLVLQSYLEQHLLPGLLLDDHAAAVAEFSRGFSRWWRQVARSIGPASGARAVVDVGVGPLLAMLGHEVPRLVPCEWGLAGRGQGRAPIVVIVVPWITPLDGRWRDGIRGGIAADASWALISNGHSMRLVDCSRAWTRLSIDFSFEALVHDPRGAAALWALARADAFGAGEGRPGPTLAAVIAGSNQFAARVCGSIGDGVLDTLPELTAALACPGRAMPSAFEQALTVVYRVLFLLFAEARGLVPVWHEIYREGYTIDAMCRRIEERPAAPGLWNAFQAISRMAHSGCRAGDLDVTAFNGRLFSPAYAPLAERRHVPDAVVGRMILSLATTGTRAGRQRIAYHDLGVEQLGSVYERVLEYEPSSSPSALGRTSTERKATGSFYTPRSITGFLVRRTLHPLVDGKTADEILSLRIVDPAMGSGAFLVAACRYLSEQCEAAMVRDGHVGAADLTLAERSAIRRRVAERCLFGVDLNPTAVQVARLSLWLTTLASDRPLTFLDHHLAVGDSLIGAGLSDLARLPGRLGRDRRSDPRAPSLPLFEDNIAGILATRVLPERFKLALEASDTLDAVRRKERRLAALTAATGPSAQWWLAADVWSAASLWIDHPPSPGLSAELLAGALGGVTTLPEKQLAEWTHRASAIAREHSAFHWELAFPEVFFDADGRPRADAGFDAVIGNPPWDMVRADLGSAAERASSRARISAFLRFARRSGIYQCQSDGHPNRYQLFLERSCQLARPGGRVGLILPSGLGTDHGSAALRRRLFDRCTIDTWLGFENRQRIFPIHRSVRFLLLCATNAGDTQNLSFRCGLSDASVLEEYSNAPQDDEPRGGLIISRSRLEAWDPDQLTVPALTSPMALAIVTQANGAAPSLCSQSGWAVRFGRELNATEDRPHFVDRVSGRGNAMPIVEGKHLEPFRVRLDEASFAIPRNTAARLIDARSSFGRARLAYRDVASATNRVTLIAALLPKGSLSTHTVYCLKTPMALSQQWCLLAMLNSLVANYLVRLVVTTHVTATLMSRLPVPRPRKGSVVFDELVALARSLAKTGIDATPDAFARLNAMVAQLYQLTPDQYAHVVESFPLLPEELRSQCLQAYQSTTETRKHGTTEAF